MLLIIGLGNPGEQYKETRHNIGFMVLEKLIRDKNLAAVAGPRCHFKINKKFKSKICKIEIKGKKILLAKPQTFVNLSGKAVSKIVKFYKIKKENIWVISDDLDLPLSRIRIRSGGSSGGHRGLESIIEQIGEYFVRVRIGINRIEGDPRSAVEQDYDKPWTKQFVLARFSRREQAILKKVIQKTVDYLVAAIKAGKIYDTTMEAL